MGKNARAATRITETVAEELRMARAKRKLRLVDVAADSAVPTSTLSRLFLGERAINVDEFVRVCLALGLDPGEVLKKVEGTTRDVIRELSGQASPSGQDGTKENETQRLHEPPGPT